jgi:PAS domain S-box-containing protein
MKPDIKFLQSLFEVSHIEYQSYDLTSQKLVFSSGVAHQLLGYSVEQYYSFSDHYFKELVHPEDRQKVEETIQKVYNAKDGEVVEMTVRLRRADGNYIWLYSRQMILERADNGHHCSIIREAEDITSFKELQAKLCEKVNQLQSISYTNSHQLRSPVASIIGLMGLIEEKHITSEHNLEVFGYLKQTISKLDTIIREINEMTRHD